MSQTKNAARHSRKRNSEYLPQRHKERKVREGVVHREGHEEHEVRNLNYPNPSW